MIWGKLSRPPLPSLMSAPSSLVSRPARRRSPVASALLALGLGMAALPAGAQMPVMPHAKPKAMPAAGQPSSALSEQRARQAAERILTALRDGDADSRYAQFAPILQRMTSPAQVQARISRMPKLQSWTINAIQPGVDSSLVEARLRTAAGQRDLTMVIDGKGLLEAYHFDVSDLRAEEVARRFVQSLIEGRFLAASGLLSPELQLEIPAPTLQIKWQRLQRSTGNVQAIRKVLLAEGSSDQKLVLVTTEFTRLTDSLFVILDATNQIVGVDFPTDQAGAAKASTAR